MLVEIDLHIGMLSSVCVFLLCALYSQVKLQFDEKMKCDLINVIFA